MQLVLICRSVDAFTQSTEIVPLFIASTNMTRTTPPSVFQIWICGSVLLWLLYSGVFILTGDAQGWVVLLYAAANVLPLVFLSAIVHRLIGGAVMRLSVIRQAALHAFLAPAFALSWYSLVAVLLGFMSGLGGNGFEPVGFSGPAAVWQSFQGLIVYALIAAICYAVRGGREAAQISIVDGTDKRLGRYLIKDSDGLRPITVESIVTITGAQDYSEVTTPNGSHLVRMSLGEFERLLDPDNFVRVHRSVIINLAYLEVAEPAGGGRMVARMSGGQDVLVSRAGATLLRDLVA